MIASVVAKGCPSDRAASIVDDHAELEQEQDGTWVLWLYGQGAGLGDLDSKTEQELRVICDDLATVLRDTNAEMVDRAVRGEAALVFWPLPGRETRKSPRTAGS
jgi:hypothetical protein